MIGPLPAEFLLFGLVLGGVALSHRHALPIAAGGTVAIALYKILFGGFATGAGVSGFTSHLAHEWVILANLLLLLLGFALLARQFEDSRVPALLPKFLPDDWTGCWVLLWLIAILSSFLDNIAAALIGGTIALAVFRGQVHIGYVAAIVAASNAGGAASVVGDTTTTMMWIAGIAPLEVAEAAVGATVALFVFGIPASLAQQRFAAIQRDPVGQVSVDWARVMVVAGILLAAIAVNVTVNTRFNEVADRFPFLGAAVWTALLATALLRAPDWRVLPAALRSAVFLLSLVLCASMMPVERLPAASWQTAFWLGFLSSVFDNIPLTALALKQGGHDWGLLAFAVGFGGSMIWFGSSAGVAITSLFPQARSAGRWIKSGWFVALAYVIAYFAMLIVLGWEAGSVPRTVVE